MREKWNSRYLAKGDRRPKVPGYIKEQSDQWGAGKALDLGAGDGAASLFLAANGWAVTAVDIADQGLKRLSLFAAEDGLEISTYCFDLDAKEWPDLGSFDLIVISHFKPEHSLWHRLPALLNKEGRLVLTSFNLEHHRNKGFSERFCLAPEEFAQCDGLQLVEYKSIIRDGDFMDDYCFQKL